MVRTTSLPAVLALAVVTAAPLAASPAPAASPSLDRSLAPRPPMGWNSWNRFGCDVSEQLIKEIAQALVQSGMRDAGYR